MIRKSRYITPSPSPIVHDEIFGNFICIECCLKGDISSKSGWGDSSRIDKTCQCCKLLKRCHIVSTSDMMIVKSNIRNSKINDLGI